MTKIIVFNNGALNGDKVTILAKIAPARLLR